MKYNMPPILHNEKGQVRKIGFELEFGGLELEAAAQCVVDIFGGEIRKENPYLWEVNNTTAGAFHIKMDSRDLTEHKLQDVLENVGINTENETVSKLIGSVYSILVPHEVDMPAIPITDIERLDELRNALYKKDAQGAHASLLNIYATHINAEIPKLDVSTLIGYLRAFLLLYPWLYEKSDIALGRRIARFIRPFTDDYIALVLAQNYFPDDEQFINDYHQYNPNRNRPLDLYPLLACINSEHVNSFPDIGKCNPRPALHYRLPNSQVNEEGWSLAEVWNPWVEVEKLASDKAALKELSENYLVMKKDLVFGFDSKWVNFIEEWLKGRE